MTVIKKRLISSRAALIATLEARKESLSDESPDVDVKRGVVADYRAGAPLSEQEAALAEARVIGAPSIDAEDRARESKELDRLIAAARRSRRGSQIRSTASELGALISGAITGKPEKVIVFTEFRDTHEFLRQLLERNGYAGRIAVLTGCLNRGERTAEIERFAKPGIDVLLATDAASEGLNLQEHCRVLYHYELPWNPNRLEQRNGRVHRYGQRQPVIVRNFTLVDTMDARILELLMEKTRRSTRNLVLPGMSSASWRALTGRSCSWKAAGMRPIRTRRKPRLRERARGNRARERAQLSESCWRGRTASPQHVQFLTPRQHAPSRTHARYRPN